MNFFHVGRQNYRIVFFCLDNFQVSELVFLWTNRERVRNAKSKGYVRCKLNDCDFACKTKLQKWWAEVFFFFAKKIFRELRLSFISVSGIFFTFHFFLTKREMSLVKYVFFIQFCCEKYSVSSCTCIWYFLSFFCVICNQSSFCLMF